MFSSVRRLLVLASVAIITVAAAPSTQTQATTNTNTPSTPSSSSLSPSSPSSNSTAVILNSDEPLTRFLFGSCNQQDKPQPLWPIMQERKPQLFMWLGDVIYADKATFEFIRRPSALTTMKSMYRAQYTHPGYSEFRKSTKVIGIYDDHDYGENDGHIGYVDKEPARQLFLDFIDEPLTSPRRSRDGIYQDYIFGPSGRRTKMIFVDARYNRQPLEDDVLGAKQWSWLESSIDSDDDIQLYIFVTGVQFVSTDKRIGEGWRLTPRSRRRVFDMFIKRKKNLEASLIFLSGDIHFAEADVTYICSRQEEGEDNQKGTTSSTTTPSTTPSTSIDVTPFYEFTSSGMTHSVGSQVSEPLADRILSFILDERLSQAELEDPSQQIRGYYPSSNFGQIDIDWNERRVMVQMVDTQGFTRLRYMLPFESLSKRSYENDLAVPSLIATRCESEDIRHSSPPMFVIPGVKFAILCIILVQLSLGIFVAGVWHWYAKRAEWKEKTRAARHAFKMQLQEKKEKAAAKKKN